MTVIQFPFVTDSTIGDVPKNFYPVSDSERGIVLEPSPGLDLFSTLTGCTEVRGLYAWGSYMYAVTRRGSKSPVFRINSIGAATEIGEIDTSYTGPVSFATNPTQLCIADGVSGWVYKPATGAVAEITDTDFTTYAGAGGVTYQDSYGLWFATGADSNKWFFSDTNDFTAYDATDVYAQRARNDNIKAILSHRQQVWLMGDEAFEVWYNAGGDNTSSDNPTFALYKDGVYDVGIIAPATLTDMQGAAVCWLSNRRDLIMSAGGIAPTAVTNGMFSRALADYSNITDANAFSYVDGGHTFVQINFPTADVTWVFDATTKLFHKKQSRKADLSYGRHRGNCYAYFNNKHYVGDFENGKVYHMSPDYYDDDGEPIRRELYTRELDTGITPVRHPPAQLITESGVGLVGEDAPQIMLRYSNDGGHTWSSEIWKDAGKIGEYYRKAVWWRLGSSSKRIYHIVMTDPVLWRVLGIDTGQGAK